MFKHLFIALFLIISTTNTYSQNNSTTKRNELSQALIKYKNLGYSQLIKFAKQLENEGSYVNAVEYYLVAHKKKPTNKFVLQKLSYLNYELRDFVSSEEFTQKLLDVKYNYDKDAPLRLAMCQKANRKFKEAKAQLTDLSESKKKRKDYKSVENELKGAQLALQLRDKSDPKLSVTNVAQISGRLQEYAPQPLANDNLIYSSLLSDTALNVTYLKNQGKDYTSKLLFSHFDFDNDQWSRPELLPEEINVPEIHIGNSYMDKSGKLIYYTQCTENEKLKMDCKLFLAEKIEDKWKTEELVSMNKKGNTNTQPAIYDDSTGNKYLLFVSDRKGGKGKLDIYYTKLNEKGRPADKEPTNLSIINTFNDDVTPFYHSKTRTLYFSSNGYPNIGGFDVFKVVGDLNSFKKVENLQYPINSSLDDIYLKLDDNNEGYFVSNREGSKSPRGATCCDDLWSVKKKTYNIWLKGYYISSMDTSNTKLKGVSSIMIDEEGKPWMNKITTDSPFYVKIKPNKTYRVNGELAGYFPSLESFTSPAAQYRDDTIHKVFILDPILKKRYIVENIYYAFDKSVVRTEYNKILDSVYSVLQLFPDMFLRIDGHTDSRGSVEYNQALSERRCKAAAEYLLLKGLEPERIIMRGYSELVPLAPNVTPSGEDDPAGRAKNRRVEFKVLSPNGSQPDINLEYRVNLPFSIE